MKLLFKQRFFSWFDSYDIYDETGEAVYEVRGRLSWGHCLEIFDRSGQHMGTVKEEVLTFLPRFRMYLGESYLGEIKKKLTFFHPAFELDCNGWQVQGDFWEWNYHILDQAGQTAADITKELWNFTDTYTIDIPEPRNALVALMVVLAIDAAKCSSND